jgi:hypothetical protein
MLGNVAQSTKAAIIGVSGHWVRLRVTANANERTFGSHGVAAERRRPVRGAGPHATEPGAPMR